MHGVVAVSRPAHHHQPTRNHDTHRYMSSNLDLLNEQLPHPREDSWEREDTGFDNGDIQRLKRNGVIKKDHIEHNVWRYQTRPGAWELLQELLENRSPTWDTCGHGGIVNIRGGGYTCGYDACMLEYTKGEAMEDYWDG